MVLSREEKHKAYREAESILALGKKWQALVPGERRPNFERAAAEVLRRALKHTVVNREQPLNISNRLMHQHPPREARLIERTLRNGIMHPDILHSFQHDRRTRRPMPLRPASMGPDPEDLPDFDLHVLDTTYNYEHPSHLDVRRGEYVSKMHQPAGHTPLVVGRMPQVGRGDGLAAHV